MNTKLFKVVSMESEDEPVGMDTDTGIEEVPENGDDGGTESAEVGDSGTENTEEDKDIVFPDVGNLNVDKVAEVLDEESERKEQVDDAIEENRTLAAAVEAFADSMRLNGGAATASMVQLGDSVLKGAKARLGHHETSSGFAMEGFREKHQMRPTLANRCTVALESFGNFFKEVWEAIVKAIQRAIDWIKNVFRGFFGTVERSSKTTKELTSAIIKNRNTPRWREYEKSAVGLLEYVTLSTDKKRFLTLYGQLPENAIVEIYSMKASAPIEVVGAARNNNGGGITSEMMFERLFALSQIHEKYPQTFGDDFIKNLSEACDKLGKKETLANIPPLTIIHNVFPDNPNLTFFMNSTTYKGKTPAKPENAMYASELYLGDLKIFNEVQLFPAKNFEESVTVLGEWKFEAVTGGSEAQFDGWMPYMSDDNLKEFSENFIGLNRNLDSFEKTVDKMENFHSKLKKLAEEMVVNSTKHLQEQADANSPTNGRSQMFLDISKMINNVISNINVSLLKYSTHLAQVTIAWNAYLKEVYDKEKKITAQ